MTGVGVLLLAVVLAVAVGYVAGRAAGRRLERADRDGDAHVAWIESVRRNDQLRGAAATRAGPADRRRPRPRRPDCRRPKPAGCVRAGRCPPAFVTYDGDDPAGYVLAVNIQRRNLTKGQQAMVAARAGRISGQTQREIALAQNLGKSRLGQAVQLLDSGSVRTVAVSF